MFANLIQHCLYHIIMAVSLSNWCLHLCTVKFSRRGQKWAKLSISLIRVNSYAATWFSKPLCVLCCCCCCCRCQWHQHLFYAHHPRCVPLYLAYLPVSASSFASFFCCRWRLGPKKKDTRRWKSEEEGKRVGTNKNKHKRKFTLALVKCPN